MKNLHKNLDHLAKQGSDEYQSYPEEFRQRALQDFQSSPYDRDNIALLIEPRRRSILAGHNHQDLFKEIDLSNLYLEGLFRRIYPGFREEFEEYLSILIEKVLLRYPPQFMVDNIFVCQCPIVLTDNSLYEGIFTFYFKHLFSADKQSVQKRYVLSPAAFVIEIELSRLLRVPSPFRHSISPSLPNGINLDGVINAAMRKACYPNRIQRYYSDVYSILTNRQLEVARLKAKGLSDAQVAEELKISINRVRELWRDIKRRCRDKADYAMYFDHESNATIEYLRHIGLIPPLWKKGVRHL